MRQKFSWATSSPQARIDAITRKNELAYNTTRAVFTDTDGEGDRLLTTFLAGLRCSHGGRCVALQCASPSTTAVSRHDPAGICVAFC